MFLTRDCEMGIRAALHLAMRGPEEGLSAAQIAEDQQISYRYLEHVLGRLVKGGVLDRLPDERYRLARAAEAITVRALVESFGGPLELTRCLVQHGNIHPCEKRAHCDLHAMWQDMRTTMMATMESHTLAEMADRARKTAETC